MALRPQVGHPEGLGPFLMNPSGSSSSFSKPGLMKKRINSIIRLIKEVVSSIEIQEYLFQPLTCDFVF